MHVSHATLKVAFAQRFGGADIGKQMPLSGSRGILTLLFLLCSCGIELKSPNQVMVIKLFGFWW